MTSTGTASDVRRHSRVLTCVWLILSMLTVTSWWIGPVRSPGIPQPSVPITVVVLALGAVKCRMVIRYFMDVRSAPMWLRVVTDAWLVLLWGAVLAIYAW
ncbi:prokaryotic cytochrome C oxidase subunit IV family protein [Mycobacterium sp. 852013-50091_SCH5140682]|uniref:cytochrome C oxidase subunit IV family protein n=1 Tax=Mycobacterium sp. 852013-50091_SCH5140682 TaxID=1834109 RepID=UPI0007E9C3DB|nr:cytochrome C oxidase subunit IV family protein [Mycobacterium sp. 852013-50091_SCH5140682]OBC01075.1 prokaryotic cytochrome C oxidase subunit IV family protein [Mycobacterium sp. 852013-50091_SCH5140682]